MMLVGCSYDASVMLPMMLVSSLKSVIVEGKWQRWASRLVPLEIGGRPNEGFFRTTSALSTNKNMDTISCKVCPLKIKVSGYTVNSNHWKSRVFNPTNIPYTLTLER